MAELATSDTQTGYLGVSHKCKEPFFIHSQSLSDSQKEGLKLLWRGLLQRLDSPSEEDQRQYDKQQRSSTPTTSSKWRQRKLGSRLGALSASKTDPGKDNPQLAPSPISNIPAKSQTSISSTSQPGDVAVAVDLSAVYFEEFWNMVSQHHPDSILLRFLRARKWNYERALDMLCSAIKWRVEYDVQGIFERGEDALPAWMNTSGVVFFHRIDLKQRPVILINSRFYDKSASPVEENKKQAIYIMELAKNYFVTPESGTVNVVMDLGNFAMSNFDMGFTKFMISVLEAYYPESLGIVLIMNAPMLFNGIWKLVKPLLDPVVAAKVVFATPADMPKYIDKESLMAHQGGTDPYTYKFLEPVAASVDTAAKTQAEDTRSGIASEFLEITRKWAILDTGELEKARDEKEQQLRKSWWDLEKYFVRNMYHRMGVIADDGGRVEW